MKLVAWVEIAESSAMEKALRQGQSLELRAKVVSRLQEAMGFDLAASRLKSRTVLPQSLQEQRGRSGGEGEVVRRRASAL